MIDLIIEGIMETYEHGPGADEAGDASDEYNNPVHRDTVSCYDVTFKLNVVVSGTCGCCKNGKFQRKHFPDTRVPNSVLNSAGVDDTIVVRVCISKWHPMSQSDFADDFLRNTGLSAYASKVRSAFGFGGVASGLGGKGTQEGGCTIDAAEATWDVSWKLVSTSSYSAFTVPAPNYAWASNVAANAKPTTHAPLFPVGNEPGAWGWIKRLSAWGNTLHAKTCAGNK